MTLLLLFVSVALYGQTIESRAVMLKGTATPGTCVVGERFFDTDATAGANLFLCTATNVWTLASGSGSVSALTDLTDCKVTTSGATATMAACNVSYLGTDGRWAVQAMSAATWVISGGTDTGTARFEIDPNGGSPIFRCLGGTGLTLTNYTPTGCTETGADAFSVGTYPLASVAVVSGAWSTITPLRAIPQIALYTVGRGLLQAGNNLTGDMTVIGERVLHVKYWGTGTSFVLQDTDDELSIFNNRYGTSIAINSVTCEADTGTPTLQLQKDDGAPTNMLSANLTCATTPATTSTFVSTENTLAVGDRLDALIVAAGGTAHWVAVTIAYTVN